MASNGSAGGSVGHHPARTPVPGARRACVKRQGRHDANQQERGCASRLREAGLPVGAVGLISAEQAESILTTGQADVISLARPLLVNPHLPITWAPELRAPNAPPWHPTGRNELA